jgi:SAM-dependent methyltransferase
MAVDTRYDARHIARFFDEYGEREWDRLEARPMERASFEVHRRLLDEFVSAGDRVLEVGAGPGRFTLELARIGARTVVADLSPRQLELHLEKTAAIEEAVEERILADVLDLTRFGDGAFDAAVCYGGPISYVVERGDEAVAELLRVTRAGGRVLFSVMSLLGSARAFFRHFPELIERFGWDRAVAGVFATGLLDGEINDGHVMRMYRWRELAALLGRHGCRVVAASASNFLSIGNEEAFALSEDWLELEVAACREPGALDGGTHIVAVVEKH